MIYLGIDPGLDGAMAAIYEDGSTITSDTPSAKDGKKRRYQIAVMVQEIRNLQVILDMSRIRACIERVHSMPKQGVASSFTFGEGFGLWQGILAGLGIPFDLVTPQAWKKALMDGQAKEKDASRIVAQRLFPSAELHLKKHHGRADALLIAEYRRRKG